MANDTLIIKKLPYLLSINDKINFLKECGAVSVNIIGTSAKKNNIAFARFQSEHHAKKALHHLHQQEVLGSYLVVEFARSSKACELANQSVEEFKLAKIKETGTEALLKKFFGKLNYWAGGVDFRAPIPSHLNYHYPPPTTSTLNNILNQLTLSTKFYTQVLHLMNKMNLPCPFVNEVPSSVVNLSDTRIFDVCEGVPPVQSTESESEISSEEDLIKETIPQLKPKIKKVIKRPRVTKQINLVAKRTKKQKIDEIFEDPRSLIEKKEIPKDLMVDVDKTSINDENLGFGYIHPKNKPKEPDSEMPFVDVRNVMEEERLEKEVINCIALEELKLNRISEKDRALLPVFKNYAEGAPTCRLYVKNLSKQTSEDQLKFIYSRFLVENSDDTPNTFDIRLMQEGRMKGQAFITLQTVESAKQALSETNGFILNDKPMVVQFARSAVK